MFAADYGFLCLKIMSIIIYYCVTCMHVKKFFFFFLHNIWLAVQRYYPERLPPHAGGHLHLAVWPDGCKQQHPGFLLHLRYPLPPAGTNSERLNLHLLNVFNKLTPLITMYLIISPVCSLSQGLSVMLVFTVFNSEVQEAWRVACLGKKSPGEDPPRPPQSTVSGTHFLFVVFPTTKTFFFSFRVFLMCLI